MKTFNSLSRDHDFGSDQAVRRGEVSPFNSLSRDHLKDEFGLSWREIARTFQLPLSGSHRRSERECGPRRRAFNSLSRDHLMNLEEKPCTIVVTFNSLSRDHELSENTPQQLHLSLSDFQLPLSGSQVM